MADRKLRSTVILSGGEGNPPLVLLAGTTPTAEQAKRIDNPKAWEGYDPSKAERSNVTTAAPVTVNPDGSEPEDGNSPPADSAKKDVWVKYAASIGVTVDKKNPTKKDYQDAVAKAAK